MSTSEPINDALREEASEAVGYLSELYNQVPTIVIRLLSAGVVIVVGILALRFGKKMIRKSFARKHKKKPENMRQLDTFESLFISVFSYLVWFFIAMITLSMFGVDVSSLLTVAGISGIAIGFGAQTLVKDVISGMFLWTEGRVTVGDVVTVAGQTGTVETMSLRTTVLRLTNGSLVAVPNGDIRTVVNMTRDYRVAQVDVTIAHGQDYQAAIAVLTEACERLAVQLSLRNPPEVLGFVLNDGRAAAVRIECRCETGEVWALEREIRAEMLETLFQKGIRP